MTTSDVYYSNILNEVHKRISQKKSESSLPMDLSTTQELVCNDCGESFRGTKNSRHKTCRYQLNPLYDMRRNLSDRIIRHQKAQGNVYDARSNNIVVHQKQTTALGVLSDPESPRSVSTAEPTLQPKGQQKLMMLPPNQDSDSLTDKKFICEEEGCTNNTFATSQGLILHKKHAHLGIKYPCWECPYKATQLGNLKRHIRRKHDEFKTSDYACSICGDRFTTKWGLIEHDKAIHKKIRDLICKVCGDAFSRKKCLQVHMKCMHSEERRVQNNESYAQNVLRRELNRVKR